MQLDAEQALEAARRRRNGSRPARLSAAERAAQPDTADAALRLIGIYGVGSRLFAEVRSAKQAFLFRSGHFLPIGHLADDDTYRLKELAGACIRLERRQKETVLCLSRADQR